MTGEIDYSVEIEHYRGPKKPKMPAAKAKKSVPTLKFLAIMEISLNRTQETDFAFWQDVITSDNCPEFNGYNTRECREAAKYINARTNADYLPLIDMTPSDPDTIMTAMSKAKSLTVKYGQDFIYKIMESMFEGVFKVLTGKKFPRTCMLCVWLLRNC